VAWQGPLPFRKRTFLLPFTAAAPPPFFLWLFTGNRFSPFNFAKKSFGDFFLLQILDRLPPPLRSFRRIEVTPPNVIFLSVTLVCSAGMAALFVR